MCEIAPVPSRQNMPAPMPPIGKGDAVQSRALVGAVENNGGSGRAGRPGSLCPLVRRIALSKAGCGKGAHRSRDERKRHRNRLEGWNSLFGGMFLMVASVAMDFHMIASLCTRFINSLSTGLDGHLSCHCPVLASNRRSPASFARIVIPDNCTPSLRWS